MFLPCNGCKNTSLCRSVTKCVKVLIMSRSRIVRESVSSVVYQEVDSDTAILGQAVHGVSTPPTALIREVSQNTSSA